MNSRFLFSWFVLLGGLFSFVAQGTPLDDYVKAPDASFTYGPEPARVVEDPAYTARVWKMVSQTWRSASEVDRPQWEHWLIIIEPKQVLYPTAMMFVGDGGNDGNEVPEPSPVMGMIAAATNSIIAEIKMIPNQPLKFSDEKDPRFLEKGRVEDEFIAYTWDKFMTTGDVTWPARLPMTKAVVRAMDVVQAQHANVRDFFVAGGSKRGWTTWTTAAVDPRVAAITPAVIDILNVETSMQHHHDVYGHWSDAIADYTDMKIMDRIHTPEFRNLLKIVDPYVYVDRLTMPKYVAASTGDEFFLPDSSQFYFDSLPEPKYLRYIPNTSHGLSEEAYFDMTAFYMAILDKAPLPKFSWTKEADGSLVIRPETPPTAVRLWQATNPNARCFRLDVIGKAWTSSELTAQDGVYVAKVDSPGKGWTAFFAELEYAGKMFPLKFTTEICVTPQTIPHRNVGGWGKMQTAGKDADVVTVVELGGTRYEMGYWYGRLLAQSVAGACKGIMSNAEYKPELFDQAVKALWKPAYFDTTMYELELRGVADGCCDAGHPEVTYRVLQHMTALGDIAEYGCSLFAAWGKATVGGELYQLRNLDWAMDTGLQDYPVVAIYNPSDGGNRHATIGFAGMMGASIGGMNAAGLAVSEIQGHFGDAETLEGIPFPILLRDVLLFDTTLEQALTRIKQAVRTNQYHYAIADPAAPDPQGRLLFTSHSRCDVYTDDAVVTQHPVENPTPFHLPLEDALYWKKHNGSGNEEVFNAIKERHGAIDAPKAIEIAQTAGVDGTLVSIVYHNTGRDFWVAYAEGATPAHKQQYVHVELGQK